MRADFYPYISAVQSAQPQLGDYFPYLATATADHYDEVGIQSSH